MVIFMAIWVAFALLGAILFGFLKEPVSLSLIFSAVNAIVTLFFGFGATVSCGVFLGSFGVLIISVMSVSLCLKLKHGRTDNEFAQKEKGKSVKPTKL